MLSKRAENGYLDPYKYLDLEVEEIMKQLSKGETVRIEDELIYSSVVEELNKIEIECYIVKLFIKDKYVTLTLDS